MAQIIIVASLEKELRKKFNQSEALKIVDLMYSLNANPKKGKLLGSVGGIVIKELKYKSFRFYFLTDGFKLKFFSQDALEDLLLMFVRMSDKKAQTIYEIKNILIQIGPSGFV